jgi:hypothetical protein
MAWDEQFSKRDGISLQPSLHILESLPSNMYIPAAIDRSSCHVVCTRKRHHESRPSRSIWLPDRYLSKIICSNHMPNPPPRSFFEFYNRIISISSPFASDLCTMLLLAWYWNKMRRIFTIQQRYAYLAQQMDLLKVLIGLIIIRLIIYVFFPGSDTWYDHYIAFYQSGIVWELLSTAVLGFFLLCIIQRRVRTRRMILEFASDDYRGWSIIILLALSWPTLHLFRFLVWKYTDGDCIRGRLSLYSDWWNMVWFWDSFNEWDEYIGYW